jgi:FAD/FMN-containing dehydrogenase
MVGGSLGAGVGKYQGVHGLIIDSLESVELVTAKGDLITVSAHHNPDLWWGIRGAGFNFGIITHATYKVYDLTNKGSVMNADFQFPGHVNQSVFEILATFNGKLPNKLAFFGVLANDPDHGVSYLCICYDPPENNSILTTILIFPAFVYAQRCLHRP